VFFEGTSNPHAKVIVTRNPLKLNLVQLQLLISCLQSFLLDWNKVW